MIMKKKGRMSIIGLAVLAKIRPMSKVASSMITSQKNVGGDELHKIGTLSKMFYSVVQKVKDAGLKLKMSK